MNLSSLLGSKSSLGNLLGNGNSSGLGNLFNNSASSNSFSSLFGGGNTSGLGSMFGSTSTSGLGNLFGGGDTSGLGGLGSLLGGGSTSGLGNLFGSGNSTSSLGGLGSLLGGDSGTSGLESLGLSSSDMSLINSLIGGDSTSTGSNVDNSDDDDDDDDSADCPNPTLSKDVQQTTATKASATGDPHFVGYKGQRYDVMGQDGAIANLISTSNSQINIGFKAYGAPGSTIIGSAGIKVGTAETGFVRVKQLPGQAPTLVNGSGKVIKTMKDGDSFTFDTGLLDPDNLDDNGKPQHVKGSLSYETVNGVKTLKVNTGSNEVSFADNGTGLDCTSAVTTFGMDSDSDGLLGQSADDDAATTNGATGAGAQGQGFLKDVWTSYKVDDLFSDDFAHNKFGTAQTEHRVGAGAVASSS